MNKKLLFFAPLKSRSGYGARARDIAKCLINKRDEYDIYFMTFQWGDTPETGLNNDLIESHIVKMIDFKPDIFIHLSIPPDFQQLGKFNIGMTAGIESDRCKIEWIHAINKMDMIICSSNHTLGVLKHTYYDKINNQTGQLVERTKARPNLLFETLFEGINTKIYSKENIKKIDIIDNINEDFCFLFVGHWMQGPIGQDRKDVGMMIKTFMETFKDHQNPPGLILKTSGATFSIIDRENILSKIRSIQRGFNFKPNVYLLHGDLTDEEMNSLYNHEKIKAMISFTKGEGFGRPLLEFSLSGKPVIASNWSGHIDFLDPNYSVLVPGNLTEIHPQVIGEWFAPKSKWFTINYQYAKAILKDVYKNYFKYSKMGRRQAVTSRNNFTIEKMEDKLFEILKNNISALDEPEYETLSLPKLQRV